MRLHDGVTPGGHEILNLYSFLNFFAPDYNSGVLLGSADSNHTVSEYGYIQFVGSGITNGYAIGYINDIQVSKMGSSGFQNGEKAGFYFVIPGDTARIDKGSVYFYKLRGLS